MEESVELVEKEDREKSVHYSPRQIVEALDHYIVGQSEAKKAVAIALRNRFRRQKVDDEIRKDIKPKNILMIGPTGVGKTEISRRLAELTSCPFVKVEASKFTEVGYVGRDVESMIRDLVEASVNMVREQEMKKVEQEAKQLVQQRIVESLVPSSENVSPDREKSLRRTRRKFEQRLKNSELEDRYIEIKVQSSPFPSFSPPAGMPSMVIDFQDMMSEALPEMPATTKRVKIKEARNILLEQEMKKLINQREIKQNGLELAAQTGIIFIDELDKIAASGEQFKGPGVSRQGVQRDILPLLEGSTVRTRYGTINTETILFIAAGAFNMSKPSDLIPELQGRLPIRVELNNLDQEDFELILKRPKDALTKQYQALMDTENLGLKFEEEALTEIAKIASKLNESMENIGARRLQTVMEKLMEEISFEVVDLEFKQESVITADYVREKLEDIVKDRDLSRYIL